MQDQQASTLAERDDIIIFSEALSMSTHNVKNIQQYRKRHHEMIKKQQGLFPNSTECSGIDKGYVWTIDYSEKVSHQQNSSERLKLDLGNFPQRRTSLTSQNKRRKSSQNGLKAQNRTLPLANNLSTRENFQSLSKKKEHNKYSTIQKKYNKGPLKQKYIVEWLNALLMEACFEQKFDITVENPALKKYGLDENSMKSKGIRPENLTRLYKSLFVYSIGFNNLLNQICQKSMNLRKTVWKVFAILLQYCAQGSFETMIAQIQRDKIAKIENLRNEIKQRQKMIDDSAQINQVKNARIYKQIKQLRQQNQNLNLDKQVLLEEFKQAEQAFNQEVTLRLRYENKINQIHGVYSEIQNKHHRLVHDFNQMKAELKKVKNLSMQQAKQLIDVKNDNDTKRESIKQLNKQLKYQNQLVFELEAQKDSDANTNIQNVNSLKDMKFSLQQKNRETQQLALSLKNSNLLFETQKFEHSQTAQSLSASLQQNKKLHATIQQQMRDLNNLLFQKRQYGIKNSESHAESAIAQRRLQEKYDQIKLLNKKIQDLKQEVRKAHLLTDTQKKLKLQIQADLDSCHQNIKQMKNSKNIIEEELAFRKKHMASSDQMIYDKDLQIRTLKNTILQLQIQCATLKQTSMSMQSKIDLLTQKMKASEEISFKKITTLKQEKEVVQKAYMDFDSVKKMLEIEVDKYKSRCQQAQDELKNQKFERTNLNIFYKNSLNTGLQKNGQIKKLDIKVSEMQEQIIDLKRGIKSAEYILEQKQKYFKKELKKWQQRIDQLAKQNRDKKHHVHPIIFEDVAQNFRIYQQKYANLKKQLAKQVQQLNFQINLKQQQKKNLQAKYKNEIVQMTRRSQAIISKKQNQLIYESKKNNHLLQKIGGLEEKLLKYEGDGKNQTIVQREEKYLIDIKTKKQQIQSMLKQLEKAHDANTSLRENYKEFEVKLSQKQKQVSCLKQNIEDTKIFYQNQLQNKQKQMKSRLQKLQQTLEQPPNIRYPTSRSNKRSTRQNETKSREILRPDTGKSHYQTLPVPQIKQPPRQHSSESKRTDFMRKYRGAYVYYNNK